MNKMFIENENNEYKSLSDLKKELGSNYEVYLYGATISAIEEINRLQRENKQLKDGWNYIKKMLKEARQEEFNINGYCGTCTDVDIDFLLDKMQELEKRK